ESFFRVMDLSADYAEENQKAESRRHKADGRRWDNTKRQSSKFKDQRPKTKDQRTILCNLRNLRNLRIIHHYGIKPSSFAICTACVRRLASSLSNRRLECVFTVFSLTKSFSAISRLLKPPAMS